MTTESSKNHHYLIDLVWAGNLGSGTSGYTAYSRDHELGTPGKLHPILCTSDPAFRGDPSRYNPEELLIASISGCHMLWYLHLCATNGIDVQEYYDQASGQLEEYSNGSGRIVQVALQPTVVVSKRDMIAKAKSLHEEAHKMCFIANSVNFPIHCQPNIQVG